MLLIGARRCDPSRWRPKEANKVYVQMATRVPMTLLQRVKLYCVQHEVNVMRFVEEANVTRDSKRPAATSRGRHESVDAMS